MIEVTDEKTNTKLLATIICNIKYGQDLYSIYSIDRDKENNNIFISKLVKNSTGYTMDNKFKDGEKETLEDIIISILNKESKEGLKEKGVEIVNIELKGINKFDKDKCYITTNPKNIIKDCRQAYIASSERKPLPIISQKKSHLVTKNNISTILLIIFGIIIIITCLSIVIKIYL